MELIPKAKARGKVLHLQRKYYRWSEKGTYRLKKLYNLLYNPFVLSLAWFLITENKGSRTPGTDGVTVKIVKEDIGVNVWLSQIQHKLRVRTFEPNLLRRVWLRDFFKPEKVRPLGIPTLESRVVQMAMKLVLEPIFEAHFKGCSLGFRPNRGPLHAIATIHRYMAPSLGYDWVIDADLRGCFDNINHGLLLRCVRKRVQDKKILSLIKAFLKAGVMDQNEVCYPLSGTPQGGIISPLLANIYLDQLDEWYHSRYHTLTPYQRQKLNREGQPLLRLIRYADDFVILVKGTQAQAQQVLKELEFFVRTVLKMELAEEKTGLHNLKDGFDFLGYHFHRGRSQINRKNLATVILPTKEAVIRFRRKVKELTCKSVTWKSFEDVLRDLNTVIRGWAAYFRYGWVSKLFRKLDWYVNQCVFRWMRKKHKNRTYKWLRRKYYQFDIFGRRRLGKGKVFLLSLARIYPPRRLPLSSENVPTPYNVSRPRQVTLNLFLTGCSLIRTMERSLLRRRIRGRAR